VPFVHPSVVRSLKGVLHRVDMYCKRVRNPSSASDVPPTAIGSKRGKYFRPFSPRRRRKGRAVRLRLFEDPVRRTTAYSTVR
jgi:hypothetical protein